MKKFLTFLILISVSYVSTTIAISAGIVPGILFTFQNPSYVTDKNSLLFEFTCDITKSDCKINFDLSPSFTGGFSSSQYICSLDFGLASTTGEEAKCNPNTVIFTGSSDYTVHFRIIKKTDSSIFSERTFIIHSGYTSGDTSSGVLNNTGTLSNSGILTSSGILNNTGILTDSGTLISSGVLVESGVLISTGNISLITSMSAILSGVAFNPVTLTGIVHYGTGSGELISSDIISSGSYMFSGLVPDTDYIYNIGFISLLGPQEILSQTGIFRTLTSPKIVPDITFDFQNPSYVTDKNPLLSELTCDITKPDCKVNFDLSSSFTETFHSSDFTCSLDFGLENPTGEEAKCNPNTVTFTGKTEYTVHFRIMKKTDSHLFSERIFLIHSGYIPSDTSSGTLSSSGVLMSTGVLDNSGTLTDTGVLSETGEISTGSILDITNPGIIISSGGGSSFSSSIFISEPIIIVQSGLDSDNHCTKSDCVLNFEYKVRGSKEACLWDFSGGSYLSGTQNKCNPGYIHYPIGSFSVTLRVFEQGNIFNYSEKVLKFFNGTTTEIYEAKANPINHPPISIIKLQGTLGKTKVQQGNSVKCSVDECSINFSGKESYDIDHDVLTYFWNFGNGETSDRENPLSVKYDIGEYSVILRVTDTKGFSSEDTFRVSVLGKDGKEIVLTKPLDPNVFSLKITGVSPNPLGNDGISEWVEITNPLGIDISLRGCTLDDAIGKGTDPYSFGDSAVIRASSKKRYYKLQTLLSFNNTGDSVNLSCSGKLVSSLTWDYSVPEGFIVYGKEGPYSGKVRTKVLRVVDGDTIVIELYGKQEKVRLIGVDTPEIVDPRKIVQYYGKEASNFTRNQLEGREVELEFDFNPRDKYDRLLAYVWFNGVNFDSELIRLGYARSYLRFPFRYFKDFEKLGREAEKNKVGMWADAEVKKFLDADTKEDKKVLEKQLKEEDVVILNDLIEVVGDREVDSEKLGAELLDSLFIFDEEEKADTLKYIKVRETSKEYGTEDIHISLQGKLSKNRKLIGNVFICHTKTNCSVNFTAGKARKDTLYLWDFGDGETIYGANPPSSKFSIGKHRVTLKVFDTKTLNIREENFSVVVEKLVSIKKIKALKIAPIALVKKEKSLVIRGGDFIAPATGKSQSITPLQASTFGGILVLVFFGGVHVIVKRRRIL